VLAGVPVGGGVCGGDGLPFEVRGCGWARGPWYAEAYVRDGRRWLRLCPSLSPAPVPRPLLDMGVLPARANSFAPPPLLHPPHPPPLEIVVMAALNFSVYFFDVARLVSHASDGKGQRRGGAGVGEETAEEDAATTDDFHLLNTLYTSTPQQGLLWHQGERTLYGFGGSDAKARGGLRARMMWCPWAPPPVPGCVCWCGVCAVCARTRVLGGAARCSTLPLSRVPVCA
jgi:hypothetical protein